ncbi:MAG: hypothetical protein Q9198_009204, partial [Flavoplaca austrocitrina]
LEKRYITKWFSQKGRIWTYARIKPALLAEENSEALLRYTIVQRKKDLGSRLEVDRDGEEVNKTSDYFDFDRIFDTQSTGADIYRYIEPAIQALLDGIGALVIVVDGQSGTGKSHTLFNSVDSIATCAADQIFREAALSTEQGWQIRVTLSSVEVYQQEARNLLRPAETFDKNKLVAPDKKPTILPQGITRTVGSAAQLKEFLEEARQNREISSTAYNVVSSRGHSVTIQTLNRVKNSATQESRLYLVDLAGGECPTDAPNTLQSKEAQANNISRSAWSACMKAKVKRELTCGKTRADILTMLARECFDHESTCLHICSMSQLAQHYEPTITTLKFAKELKSKQHPPPSRGPQFPR